MRILQIGKFYPPSPGGMERAVGEIAEGLADRGHEVRVICASASWLPTREKKAGVEVYRRATFGTLFSQPLTLDWLREAKKFRPDVVHLHLPNPLALVETRWVAGPVCATLHSEPSGVRKYFDRALAWAPVAKVDQWIATSETLATSFRHLRGIDARAIPLASRFRYFAPPPIDDVEDDLILTVGRLVPYKGFDLLVRAMTKIAARVVIIGEGPEKRKLLRLASRLGVENKITFTGAVSDNELGHWLAKCAVYVQPSTSAAEAFGLSMLEAMHFAKPVVSTDLPTGVREVNLHERSGLVVPPKNSAALAAALQRLLQNPDFRLRLGQGALAHHLHFSFKSMIDAHESLYFDLANRMRT